MAAQKRLTRKTVALAATSVTFHSAQGCQEWKSVYLLNAVDGCMPSDLGAVTSAELEEERRLLYVASRNHCVFHQPTLPFL